MSLKRQIADPRSTIGGFLREVFPARYFRPVLAELNAVLGASAAICRLGRDTPAWFHSHVGQAIDYRIRHHFQPGPADPYPMAREGIWMVTGVDDLADILRQRPERFPDYALTMLGDSPDRAGSWQHFLDQDTDHGPCTVWRLPDANPNIPSTVLSALLHLYRPEIQSTYLPLECTLELLDVVDATVARVAAHKRRPSSGEEAELARCCLALSIFETVRRIGGRGWPPSFLDGIVPATAADLMDAIPAILVADMTALAGAFVERCPAWHGAPATLGPQFTGSPDVGGADGDLIVDGCLWEIKTTVQTRAKRAWLYQLLGYLLLDYEDDHALERAGFLFPRQQAAVHWSVTQLIRALSGRADVELTDLRRAARVRLDRASSCRVT